MPSSSARVTIDSPGRARTCLQSCSQSSSSSVCERRFAADSGVARRASLPFDGVRAAAPRVNERSTARCAARRTSSMYDATNDSIASASCSAVPGIFMWPRSHAASGTSTPRVNGYGANVLLIEPNDAGVFDGMETRQGVRYAAPSQVAADLLSSPGRGPSEGEELIRWMQANEEKWRR